MPDAAPALILTVTAATYAALLLRLVRIIAGRSDAHPRAGEDEAMRIGDQVHIFDLGHVINGRVTEILMGGTVLAIADETRDATYTRPADEVHPGWLMLGHDARSSGLGGAS